MVDHASRQLVVFNFKDIAAGEIKVQKVPHSVCEKGEPTADQQGFQTCLLARIHQGLGSRVQAQPICINLIQCHSGHTAQQGDALAQAFLVVGDLASHGCIGDGGYLGFATCGIGDLINALDVDECGVHVKGDQLKVRPMQGQAETFYP